MSENKFELIIENGVVTGYKGESKVVEIPEGVTEIGKGAFQDCQFIEEFYSKSSVLKTIDDFAFENCKNLKVCKLDALKGSIESSAFYGCKKLKSFEVPNGTIKIGSDAFGHCDSLIYVIIPSSVFVLDSYIFDVGNKKTVILGDIGSEAEEYARSKMLPFKENTPATRNELLQLENKKDNTGYKDFNIFGETIRCYKSVIVYQELLDFFKYLNSDFSKEVINSVSNDVTVFNDKSENLINLTQVYAEKTRDFLQKYGVFISDTVFGATILKYEANYLEVCGAYIDACNKCTKAIKEGTANLQSDLIAEAKSKVTGLSYGVIGDSLTMVAYAIDDYRARKRQINEAYDVAASKLTTGTNQIINQTQNIYANLLNDTLLPAFDKSVSYVCDGLMQLTIEEMLEAKVIDKKVFEIYDIAKSSKLIEQAKKNPNIDKKYAIATALKMYPLNIDAICFAIEKKLIESDLTSLIDYYGIDDDDEIFSTFENNYEYIELVKLNDKNIISSRSELCANIKYLIAQKAKQLLNKINDYYDPMQIDTDTWNSLVQKYTILYSESVKKYNITEEEVKGPNGRELLSKAIAVAREEKQKADEIRKQEAEKRAHEEAKLLNKERQEREEKERLEKLKLQQEKEKKKKKKVIITSLIFSLVATIVVISILMTTVIIPKNKFKDIVAISAGGYHTIGLNSNGFVVSTSFLGDNYYNEGQCRVNGWENIVAISASYTHTVGLKSDGTVVATKCNDNYYRGQCDVSEWTDIIAISAGSSHTVGLKSDGTVVATKYLEYPHTTAYNGQCDVEDWRDIIAVSASGAYTIGLKSDGTVVATQFIGKSYNYSGQCDVSEWSDIIAISAGGGHSVGLKSDGTVVATQRHGTHFHDQSKVGEWTDIIAISAGLDHTVGLKSDGTVVAIGDNEYGQCNVENWKNIVAISASGKFTIGLKSDGTVVSTGNNENGQCNVGSRW